VSVFCLGPEQIDNLWPEYGHHLERLEQETQLMFADAIREDLKRSDKQLWGFQDGNTVTGVALTRISETPNGKLCEVIGACGSDACNGIDAVLMSIERWASDIGCTRVRFGGRRGWIRRLKTYRQAGIILEKEL
jgi:hypothetical protein